MVYGHILVAISLFMMCYSLWQLRRAVKRMDYAERRAECAIRCQQGSDRHLTRAVKTTRETIKRNIQLEARIKTYKAIAQKEKNRLLERVVREHDLETDKKREFDDLII